MPAIHWEDRMDIQLIPCTSEYTENITYKVAEETSKPIKVGLKKKKKHEIFSI